MRSFMLCLFLLLSFSAYSEEESELSEQNWYRVEVIVFEANDKDALSEEWPVAPGRPALEEAMELLANDEGELAEFTALEKNELKLKSASRRIQKKYRLVLHQGWRQLLVKKHDAKSVRIKGGKEYQTPSQNYAASLPEIDGIIRFSGGKYLHVESDFLFHKPVLAQVKENSFGGQLHASTTAKLNPIAESESLKYHPNATIQPFRLKRSSRLRLDQIQYFDHPLYGVIIMVSQEKKPT